MFVAVPKEEYSKVSLYLAGVALFGKSMSSLTSQLLCDFASMTYLQLHYLSLASVCLAILISSFIPSPGYIASRKNSVYPTPSSDNSDPLSYDRSHTWRESYYEMIKNAYKKAKLSYGSAQTRRWAYWAIVSTTLFYMVSLILSNYTVCN